MVLLATNVSKFGLILKVPTKSRQIKRVQICSPVKTERQPNHAKSQTAVLEHIYCTMLMPVLTPLMPPPPLLGTPPLLLRPTVRCMCAMHHHNVQPLQDLLDNGVLAMLAIWAFMTYVVLKTD